MKTLKSLALCLVTLVAACSEGNPGTGPQNNLPNGTFGATISGYGTFAPGVATVQVSATHISLVTAGSGIAFTVTVTGIAAGTYLINEQTPNIAALTMPGPLSWVAFLSQGSGTVTITTVTSSRVVGSFNLNMAPQAGTTGNRTVAGNFDLTY